VTRFPALLSTGMLGTKQRIEKFRVLRRSAPPKLISPPQDQCLPAHRGSASQRSRPLVSAFPSPATAAPFQKPPFQGQRSRPDPSGPTGWFPRPVHLKLPCLRWFAPVVGSFFASGPLRLGQTGPLGCFHRLHSPPGLLPPSGSKRSTVSAASRLTFRTRPISSRSPPPVLFLGLAADQRSWFATFPEARCSSNLLEPPSLSPQVPFPSTEFRYAKIRFPQHLFHLFLVGYRPQPVHWLWIKRALSTLFWHTERVRRLVVRPGAIGDLIVSLPAIQSLRTSHFEVWAPAHNLPLIRFADGVRSISSTGLDLLAVTDPPPGLLEELRTFDSIVSWYGSNRPDFRRLVHALGLPFQFLPALPPENVAMHATDFYLHQVRDLSAHPGDATPRISCDVPRGNFAVIHPFSGSPRKNWPIGNFRRLARGLERNMRVHWCAGPDDPPLDGAVRLDNLYELACWLAGARLYVGNDCGITHLAAAVGTPVLALFGPTDPAIWAPRGPHVRVACWNVQ